MDSSRTLLENNKKWAEAIKAEDPTFFEQLAAQQTPEYLWIGCSDSRVPANQILGKMPGEVFVHRNIANVVIHTDLNCQSVIQYAVEVLKVKHVIVCGHYGCGGVMAAMGSSQFGLIDNWLRNIKDVYNRHEQELLAIEDEAERVNRLCEYNVLAQQENVCNTTTIQNAWARGQELHVHGWIYSIKDGLLRDLRSTISEPAQLANVYQVGSPAG
ncbi:carbonic anhydrase [Litorivivens lipolytica]|uniref:Carbonic anhydrase n=1 Tax=Litorivivens lipolytica TaxID=1524264 RepID=A0A7W4W413_9GAMM|nr:carbonate dehydratase [Litorivivens lipolytica]MBB3047061.1 carbonic anhydrase [Litorivivens lipolytica]